MEACLQSSAFREALARAPCEDQAAEDVVSSTGWIRYWEQYETHWSQFELFDAMKPMILNATLYGCVAVLGDPMGAHNGVCSSSPSPWTSSLRSFCPVSCKCQEELSQDCPDACGEGEANTLL